jgi:uncharacterized protein YdeI (YjbR/CyaY-like superfamily)
MSNTDSDNIPVISHKDAPVYSFETKEIFFDWLGHNHDKLPVFWLRFYKKASGRPTVVYTDSVDVALCWGWIDGVLNKYDDESYVQRFTPRRAKSTWSKINVAKVAKLTAEGLMQPCGLVHVESARADGRWDAAYAGSATMEFPDFFMKMLEADPEAKKVFDSLNKTQRYPLAYRLAVAVGDEKKQKAARSITEKLRSGVSI